MPCESSDEGWLVKVYNEIRNENINTLDKPNESRRSKYCEVKFRLAQSLPDWEGASLYCKNASELSHVLNEDEPWESYDHVVAKLTDGQNYQSQLGGYPKWVQGESTPKSKNGDLM